MKEKKIKSLSTTEFSIPSDSQKLIDKNISSTQKQNISHFSVCYFNIFLFLLLLSVRCMPWNVWHCNRDDSLKRLILYAWIDALDCGWCLAEMIVDWLRTYGTSRQLYRATCLYIYMYIKTIRLTRILYRRSLQYDIYTLCVSSIRSAYYDNETHIHTRRVYVTVRSCYLSYLGICITDWNPRHE